MDIQHLKYFISVAEHLSFTKAAAACYVAQPAISQAISAMEKQMDIELFIRDNRSVQLTPAGEAFLEEAKEIVALFETAVERARQLANGSPNILRLAYGGPYEQYFLPSLLRSFRRLHPDITVTLQYLPFKNMAAELKNRTFDLVFSTPYSFQGKDAFCCRRIDTSPMCVVLYETHPLAAEPSIRPVQLKGADILTLDLRGLRDYNWLISECRRNGFKPNIVSQAVRYEDLLLMIEAEMGIALMPGYLADFCAPGRNLRFVALEGDMSVEFSAIWPKTAKNPAVTLMDEFLAQRISEPRAPTGGKALRPILAASGRRSEVIAT